MAPEHRIVCYGNAFADRMDAVAALLGDAYTVERVPYDMEPEAMCARFAGALAVVAVGTEPGLPLPEDLRLLQVPGIGWDGVRPEHVPAGAAICNVGGHETAVAEYCLAQLLDWCHGLRALEREFRAGSWAGSSRFGAPPQRELAGATVGIIGYGGIGRELARLLQPFGVTLLAANRSPIADEPGLDGTYGLDALVPMLECCDFAIACVALTPETRGLLSDAALAALGPAGVLINVARGPVVDERALHAALTANRLGGAVLDVWYKYPETLTAADPAPAHYDFAALANVVMTPHVSGWTEGTAQRRVAAIAENIERAARGEALRNVVARGTRPA